MAMKYSEFCGYQVSSLGLGCSRLGSMMGSSIEEAEALVQCALDNGVTFFDTASCYGQGDSERILGRVIGNRKEILLVTKVGKKIPLKAKLLQPIKNLIRTFARNSSSTGALLKKSRSGPLPACFDPSFLERELKESLARLNFTVIPMVMLHSPTAAVLDAGEAVAFLESARKKGILRIVGVSVDDLSAAEAALRDERILAIQVPLYENDMAMAEWAERARQAGRLVVAREIFGGTEKDVKSVKGVVERNINRVLSSNSIGVSLVGTTKVAHLLEALSFA